MWYASHGWSFITHGMHAIWILFRYFVIPSNHQISMRANHERTDVAVMRRVEPFVKCLTLKLICLNIIEYNLRTIADPSCHHRLNYLIGKRPKLRWCPAGCWLCSFYYNQVLPTLPSHRISHTFHINNNRKFITFKAITLCIKYNDDDDDDQYDGQTLLK